jgi:DNA-binding XRE family transcriptional regulator
MAKRADFTPEQQQIIRATARKVWRKQFEWMKAVKRTKDTPARPGGQEAMALALGVSQQTVSALIDPDNKYKPGFKVATAVANLDGKTLDDLIGEYGHDDEVVGDEENDVTPSGNKQPPVGPEPFANLTTCINYNSSTKHWSPWTIAAARAGFFGLTDYPPPEWGMKLDTLERALEKVRKS